MVSLEQLIRSQSNDYSHLEEQYRRATGGSELVIYPEEEHKRNERGIAPRKSVSIVAPSFNNRQALEKFLASLNHQSYLSLNPQGMEVVIVDDGSTDGTYEAIKQFEPQFKLKYVRQQNRGRSRARNVGLKAAENDIVLFLDPDVVVLPETVEEHMKRHDVLDNMVLVGFRRYVNGDDPHLQPDAINAYPNHISHARDIPSFADPETFYTGDLKEWRYHARNWSNSFKSLGTSNGGATSFPGFALMTCHASAERNEVIRAGGFYEGFAGWGSEDQTLGDILFSQGNKILPLPNAPVLHMEHDIECRWFNPEHVKNDTYWEHLMRAPNDGHPKFAEQVDTVQLIRQEGNYGQNKQMYVAVEAIQLEHARERFRLQDKKFPNISSLAEEDIPALFHEINSKLEEQMRDLECGRNMQEIKDEKSGFDSEQMWPFAYKNNLQELLKAANNVLVFEPKNEGALYSRGFAHVRLNNQREAFSCFDASVQQGYEPAVYPAIIAALETGEYGTARELISRFPQYETSREYGVKTNTAEEMWKKGKQLAEEGKLKKAIKTFNFSSMLDENRLWTEFDKGKTYKKMGKIKEAERCFEWEIAKQPDNPWPYAELGTLRMEQGKYDDAHGLLERARELDPTNWQALEIIGKTAEEHKNNGNELYKKGNHEGAIAAYQRAFVVDQTHNWVHYDLSEALEALGKKTEDEKKRKEYFRQALEAAQQAMKIDTHTPWARFRTALCHFNVGEHFINFSEAGRLLRELRYELPHETGCIDDAVSEENILHQAEGLQARGMHSEALMAANMALAKNPYSGKAWYQRGKALKEIGEIDCTLKAYKITRNQAKEINVHQDIARVYRHKKMFREAFMEHDMAEWREGIGTYKRQK